MNVRRFVSGIVVTAATLVVSNCPAEEKITQPYLGDPEPIGSLEVQSLQDDLPFKQTRPLTSLQSSALERRLNRQMILGDPFQGGSFIIVASLGDESPVEVDSQLGEAIPLALLMETQVRASANKSSGMIYQQIQKTVHLLDAIGLHDQSLTVEGILIEVESELDELESTHRDRVALAMKRAELAKLQAEISELADRIDTESAQPAILPVSFEVSPPALLPE